MDHLKPCWIALVSFVYLALTVTPTSAYAKCKGRWAIHACYGGNGKRSDPRLAENVGEVRDNLLRSMLLREPYPYLPQPYPPQDDLDIGDNSEEEPSLPTLDKSDALRLRSLLRTLLFERNLRKRMA